MRQIEAGFEYEVVCFHILSFFLNLPNFSEEEKEEEEGR